MSDWKPDLYLTFKKERTQPAIDLAVRIDLKDPKRIVDIGCGPGNSTAVLKNRWPEAEIVGVDNSKAMIEQAKKSDREIDWVCKDASGDLSELGKYDIVFSNAAVQWISDQRSLLCNLFDILNSGGILAVQVPNTKDMPVFIEVQKLVKTPKWERHFSSMSPIHSVHEASYFYDILCGLTKDIELWVTDYHHVMESHKDIVKWYSGTGLRPYLDCFTDDDLENEFLNDFENAIKDRYPLQKDKRVLFPFTRIFFIARKTM